MLRSSMPRSQNRDLRHLWRSGAVTRDFALYFVRARPGLISVLPTEALHGFSLNFSGLRVHDSG
jgi:hypothetical protein